MCLVVERRVVLQLFNTVARVLVRRPTYALITVGLREWNQISVWFQRFLYLSRRRYWCCSRDGSCFRLRMLDLRGRWQRLWGLTLDRSDLKPGFVLVEDSPVERINKSLF